jgi:hypothetical protein
MKTTKVSVLVLVLALLATLSRAAGAQEPGQCTSCAQQAPIPFHREAYSLDSGVHDGVTVKNLMAFHEIVRAPGTPWLQLHFSDYNLGKRSYITITSLKDRGYERLNAESLAKSRNSSVYYNGDAVEVKLYVTSGEKGIFFHIEQITVGDWVGKTNGLGGLCGQDDRVSSTDPRVGRIMPIGCTGWIVSNGAHLTAGHCDGGGINMALLQFNVPPSLPDGTPQNPPPEDQYFIDLASIVSSVDGLGNDWAVFACDPDPNTGLLPVQAQGAFYRMSRGDSPTNVRATGYGEDNTPPGSTGNLNSDSQTQQTDSGAFLREVVLGPSDVRIEYFVDVMGGNSGSPVINLANGNTIGIHTGTTTEYGCAPPNWANRGVSFENDSLENAIQTFPGANVVYVDKDHPAAQEDGTIFRPFDMVAEGVTAVPSGGIVSIVTGSYSDRITINSAVTLVAPVGTVTIGQ